MRILVKQDLPEDYKDGELYEILCVGGHRFEIYCGYLSKHDAKMKVAVPLYPNFTKEPKYDPNGYRLTSCGTDPCRYADLMPTSSEYSTCLNCRHFDRISDPPEFIGICKNEKRRLKKRKER